MEMNQTQYRQNSNPQNQVNIQELISKYWNLIWQKKIFITLIFVFMSVLWYGIYMWKLEGKQKYTTSAIVKFDDPRQSRGVGAVPDFAAEGSIGKAAILQTNSFLRTVVDSLKLNFVLIEPKRGRLDIIKS